MIEKKSPKGNLEKRKNTFLIIGFVIVLGLVYLGFEFFASKPKPLNLGPLDPIEVVFIYDAPVTDKTPPPQAQQQPNYALNVVKDEIKVNLDDIVLNPEFYENEAIPDYEPIPIVGEKVEEQPPFVFPEKFPEPAGGFDAMYAFLRSNLIYPEIPRINGISGQVFVEFVVEKDGSISNVKILSSVHPELDKEAMRVVKLMPKWKPGEQLGKPIRCLYNIPIHFIIR